MVRPSQDYTEQYPRQMPAKITVRLQDGSVLEHEVQDFLGMPSHPFSWQDEVEKFDRLVAGRLDQTLSQQIKEAVHSLEGIQVKDLMELLSRVQVSQ